MQKHLIRRALFTVGFVFLLLLLWHSADQLLKLLQHLHWGYFALSVLVGIFVNFIASLFFKQLLGKYTIHVSQFMICKLFFFGQITKYIPGKVWALWYQTTLLQTLGSTSALIFANFDLMGVLLINVSAITLSLLLLKYSISLAILVFIAGLFASWIVAAYCPIYIIFKKIISYFKKMQHKVCDCHPKLAFSKLALFYVLFALGNFTAQLLMLYAVFNFSTEEATQYIIYLGLGWIVGVLAIIAPGGIGIKEFFFVFFAHLSNQAISLEVLTSIAVVSRFWQILQELLGVSLVMGYEKVFKKEPKHETLGSGHDIK